MQNDNRTVPAAHPCGLLVVLIAQALLVSCAPPAVLSVSENRLYLPIISNEHRDQLVGVENEGAAWSSLAPFYRGDFVKVSVQSVWLEQAGWAYFDRKIEGFDGLLWLTIKGTFPTWITPACAPVPEQFWPGWIDFAAGAIDHAGSERVRYVEIMNEPDTSNSYYWKYLGCWGEDYAAGVYYGRFVAAVYPPLKALYPEISFVAGALIDPRKDFARGFYDTVGNIDFTSYHVYEYCHAAPVYESRRDAARSRSAAPALLSETSLIYPVQSAECDQQQADYMRRLLDSDEPLFVWYTLGCNAWENSDLTQAGVAKPAWLVYDERMR